MKHLSVAILACALCATPALADEKPTDDEAAKIKATLTAWGCEGGTYEKESEGSGIYEVDDAKCKDGNQYDAKLGEDFSLRSLTRD